jgi:tRNA(Ile)-lysidine synthase
MGPHPAVAAVRVAVRRTLAGLPALTPLPVDPVVLVACSGGADSVALLSATVFEARNRPTRVVGVTVDHGLQERSAERADRVVAQMVQMGVDETAAVRVTVDAGGRGIEAAAREARYAVLEEVASRMGADAVLLGHTLDDQAETVLLGLTRGSGGRSIAGMRASFGRFHRPLLGVTRQQTTDACQAEGLSFWNDPHNADPRFTRARIRHRVMPVLEQELGPGVASALARTAEQLRPDVEALDRLADDLFAEAMDSEGRLLVARLEGQPDALVDRVLRLAALQAGSIASELYHLHVVALRSVLHGSIRGEVQLPGHLTAHRTEDHLRFRRTTVES